MSTGIPAREHTATVPPARFLPHPCSMHVWQTFVEEERKLKALPPATIVCYDFDKPMVGGRVAL